ncbi:hypothetical protein ACFXO9_10030 [Nocardia tengchongensis]|uniref:hypothetical protein n=1 Tax=Nocardia tengchongensis TaxID=2055889 RepID=UPI003691C32D
MSAGSQPDFYMMWTDGLARLMPPWEIYLGGYTIPADGAAGKPGAGGFLTADPAAEREALTAVRHHEERAQLMVLKAKQDNGSRG